MVFWHNEETCSRSLRQPAAIPLWSRCQPGETDGTCKVVIGLSRPNSTARILHLNPISEGFSVTLCELVLEAACWSGGFVENKPAG
jgi:hypothetical protein